MAISSSPTGQAINTTAATSQTTHTAQLSVSANDLVVVCVGSRDSSGANFIQSCTGTVNATYTRVGGSDQFSSAGVSAAIFYFEASAAGTETVTVTLASAGRASVNISTWTGAALTSALDQSNGNSNSAITAGNNHTFGSITTTGAGLIINSVMFSAAGGTETQTGFTALTAQSGLRDYFSYRVVTGSTTTDGVLTTTATSSSAGKIASFNEAVVATGQPTGSRYYGIPGMNLISSRFGRGW